MTTGTIEFIADGQKLTMCAQAYHCLVQEAYFENGLSSTSKEYADLAKENYGATEVLYPS